MLQQRTGDLRVRHLSEANSALHDLRKLTPVIRYFNPSAAEVASGNAVFLAFPDASQGKGSDGQTGYISGIFFPQSFGYHVLDWHSSKQARLSFSSIGAEILAAAESADRGSLMSTCLQQLYCSQDSLPLVRTVGSHGLFSTISTLHEGRDYRLRPIVCRLRDSFESREIAVLQ